MAVLLASTRYHKPVGNLLRGYLEIFCSQPLQGLFLLRNEIYGYYSWLFFTTSRHLVPRSSRWKDLAAFLRSARRSAAFLQRIFYRREFFLNYFKYNVYIYMYRSTTIFEEWRDCLTRMQLNFEILAGQHGHVCKCSGTKTSGRGRRNGSRLENLLFTTGLYNHLAMHLFAESKVHLRNRKHVLSICSGRKNEPVLLSRTPPSPWAQSSTALRNTCFSSLP